MTGVLVRQGVSADAISWMSVIFSTIGCAGFCLAGQIIPWWTGMLLGVAGAQGRLVCNLLDGMVAQESGKKSPLGAVMNEVPDRYSDIVLLVGAGIAGGEPWLGWTAACFAVMTAYIRSFGAELSGHQDFGGPMAKPQRMFILCLGALGSMVSPGVLVASLYLVGAGSLLTSLLRLSRITTAKTK